MVADETGYVANERELRLSEVAADAVAAMERREVPLGFDEDRWEACGRDLDRVLDELGANDADVRLQGTASFFFSKSPDKDFPATPAAVVSQAGPDHADEAVKAWQHAGYDDDGPKPGKHFWESRYRLRLSTGRSDYDFQVSSDSLAGMIKTSADVDGTTEEDRISRKGGHYKQELLAKAAPTLGLWAARWSQATKRKVNIAPFPGAGPSGPAAFDDKNDWICLAGADRV